MKPWQWLLCAALVVVALFSTMPEDAPKEREQSKELHGTVMPEVGADE